MPHQSKVKIGQIAQMSSKTDDLRNRIRHFLEYKWIETQGVEEDSILRQLPVDLRRDIKHYLCLDLVQRVSGFMLLLMSSVVTATISCT
uniref:Uncharacterized protein n=1 Tax=Arundo donax TaxID=35708 RepID=A0A0A9DH86_ARUDO